MVLHVLAWDARMVPVDLAYVIFIDFLALGVLRFCFLLLSNVQFLVLVNLPPGRSHAGGISSRHSRRRYPSTAVGIPTIGCRILQHGDVVATIWLCGEM